MSEGYFDTLWAFVDAFSRKILDLEGSRPKTKGHTVCGKLCIVIKKSDETFLLDKKFSLVAFLIRFGKDSVTLPWND